MPQHKPTARRTLAQVPLADLPTQLRIDADELSGCGAGNEAEHARQAADEIERLRDTITKWCDDQIAANDKILAFLGETQNRINEEIIQEINDPRNAIEPPAFRQGLRIARIIVNRVIGE